MGCNCRKGTRPYGVAATSKDTSTKDSATTSTAGTTQKFVLTDQSGRTQTFGSRLEAEAAKRRAGGGDVARF